MTETLNRSTLGSLKKGTPLHLELPLKAGARLDGHFVQGHVDGTGEVLVIMRKGGEKSARILYPKRLGRYFFEKGSVTVDGVSLTIGKIKGDSFWIHLVPHTLKSTNFENLVVGSKVNLEADMLAKLVGKQNK